MSERILLCSAAVLLGASFLLRDLEGDVGDLKTRVAALETRVVDLERRLEAGARSVDPADGLSEIDRVAARIRHLESRLSIVADESADLAQRAWRAKVRESAMQAYLFATQVGGNTGYVAIEDRALVGSSEAQQRWGTKIAARANEATSVPEAYRGIESGVRELFVDWVRAKKGPVGAETTADELVIQWRNTCLPIVREKLDEGLAWRAEIAARGK